MSSRSGRRLLASVAVATALAGGVGAGTAAAQTTDLSSTLAGSAELVDPETGEDTALGSTAFLAGEAVDFFLLGGLPLLIYGIVYRAVTPQCGLWPCGQGFG